MCLKPMIKIIESINKIGKIIPLLILSFFVLITYFSLIVSAKTQKRISLFVSNDQAQKDNKFINNNFINLNGIIYKDQSNWIIWINENKIQSPSCVIPNMPNITIVKVSAYCVEIVFHTPQSDHVISLIPRHTVDLSQYNQNANDIMNCE
jgi:cell division protein FtsL